jgi:hypothetical protein
VVEYQKRNEAVMKENAELKKWARAEIERLQDVARRWRSKCKDSDNPPAPTDPVPLQ